MRAFLLLLGLFVEIFSVQAQSVLPPNLYSPTNNALDRAVSIRLDWNVALNNQGYIIEIDTVSSFNSSAYQTATTSISYQNFTHLRFGTTYYWRVATIGAMDTSVWSITWTFNTSDQINISSPINNASITSVDPVLIWSNILGNTGYLFEVDTTINFNSPSLINAVTSTNDNRESTGILRFGTQYFWRVAAKTVGDTSQWSSIGIFTTTDQLTLSTPSNGAINRAVTETLNWSSASGIFAYIFQIDTVLSFNSPALFNGNSSPNFSNASVNSLKFGSTYYWRVAMVTATDTSLWSSSFSFTTLDQPTLISPSNGSFDKAVTQVLNWSSANGNTGYLYQIDTVSTFNSTSLINGVSSTNSSSNSVSDLRFGTTYYWRAAIKNSADTSMWSSTFSFTTVDQPILNSPPNGSTGRPVTETIDWISLTGNTGYLYQIDTVSSFNSPALSSGTTTTNFSQASVSNLRFGTTYYWRASIKNAADTSLWSVTYSFTTTDQAILVSPTNGSVNRSVTETLDWGSVSGNTVYLYQMDTSITFASPVLESGSVPNVSQVGVTNLRYGTKYFWRVALSNAADTSQWSVIRNFTTNNGVNLTSPPNNSTNRNVSATLNWSTSSGRTAYLYQIDTDSNFNSTNLISDTTTASSSQVTVNLLYGTEYFWRAAAKNAVDTSDWSATWKFTTSFQLLAPNLFSPVNGVILNPSINILFDWDTILNSNAYDIQVSTSNDFSTLSFDKSINITLDSIGPFNGSTNYYWRVRAKNSLGKSPWSITRNFTTNTSVGINEVLNTHISIFPNPTSDFITVKSRSEYFIKIYSMNGKLVFQKSTSNQIERIDVSSFRTGIYSVILESKENHFVTKLIIQ